MNLPRMVAKGVAPRATLCACQWSCCRPESGQCVAHAAWRARTRIQCLSFKSCGYLRSFIRHAPIATRNGVSRDRTAQLVPRSTRAACIALQSAPRVDDRRQAADRSTHAGRRVPRLIGRSLRLTAHRHHGRLCGTREPPAHTLARRPRRPPARGPMSMPSISTGCAIRRRRYGSALPAEIPAVVSLRE